MKTKKIFLTLTGLAATTLIVTGCSTTSYEHTRSKYNKVYSADINHNGKIDDDERNLTWAQSYDVLLKQAGSIKELNKYIAPLNIDSTDTKRISLARYEILHEAEELLMSTGTLVPLYNYGNSFLVKPNVHGIISCDLGYKLLYELYDKNNSSKALSNVTTCFGTKAETYDPSSNVDSSTANVIAQFMIGAKRYARGPELEPGIFDTVVEDGICTTKKRLVTNDPSLPTSDPETYISISNCPDIMEEIDLFNDATKKNEIKDSYELTARYTITLKSGAVWNTGESIKVEDFEYAWNRASSGVYNHQGFGTWCSVFDMIRGFYVWNAVGQQTSPNYEDWTPLAQQTFDALVADEENPDDARKIFLHQYKQVFDGITDPSNTFETTRKCKGGMAGFMANVAMDTTGSSVTHVADPNSFTVQLSNDCDYFEDLLAFNALFPVDKSAIIKDPDNPSIAPTDETELNKICDEDPTWWLNGNGQFHSNGPLELDGPIDNVSGGGAILKKASKVTPGIFTNPTVDRMECKFIDRQDTIYQEYKKPNGLTVIDRIPPALLESLMETPDYHSTTKIGSFYYGFNANDNVFDRRPNVDEREREKLRRILIDLINRRDITENLARGGSTPCNGYVSTGIVERAIPVDNGAGKWKHKETNGEIDTADWHKRNLNRYDDFLTGNDCKNLIMGNRDEGGFLPINEAPINRQDANYKAQVKEVEEKEMKLLAEDAIQLAKEVGINYNEATGKFTNFPKITIVTNTGTDLEDLAERIQAYYSIWGIDASIQTQEWQSFLATRRMGDFSYCRQGWIADYNDPKTYLDLYRSNDGNNDSQLGKDNWHRSK